MSIKAQIDRLSDAKDAIASAIENKGVTVASTTKLDGMATLINAIDTGGKVTSVNGATGDVTVGAEVVSGQAITPASVNVGDAVTLTETSDGRGVLRVNDASGTLSVQAYANTGSTGGEVDVFNSSGVLRGGFYVATTGNGVLRLYNSDGSYATLTKALIDKIGLTLLWSNASPTSSFAAQTITLDLSGYTLLLILANIGAWGGGVSAITYVGGSAAMTTAHDGTLERVFYTGTGGVYVESGYIYTSYGGGRTQADGSLIPIYIYGIK